MKATVVLADADNTLWDTDGVFAAAQLRLLEELETLGRRMCSDRDRLAFVRRYDQAIAQIHHAHLRYPPLMLASALLLGLAGTEADEAADSVVRGATLPARSEVAALNHALAIYEQLLQSTPPLLPTVEDGLRSANAAGLPIFILTEGKLERQRSRLTEHGLLPRVAGVFEITKTAAQFGRLVERFKPDAVAVIGDQPDRDIAPALTAGCLAVLVPGKFRPNWDGPSSNTASYVAASFGQAIDWLLH